MHKYRLHKAYKPHKRNSLIPQGISKEELEVRNFIALDFPNTPIIESDRTILYGREIDLYLPTYKVGLEFDGLYWHNDKSPAYHLYKTIECEKQGIQLLHIFSDEWENNKPLVIDLIRKTLGKYQAIEVNQCVQVNLSKAEGKQFINACTILGDDSQATDYKGLLFNNELVAVLAYSEDDTILIHSYAERRSIKVIGGLAELTKFNKPATVHLDRRLYNGKDYIDAGFNQVKATDPDIWYTQDFKSKFRGDRLTESQRTSFSKIYDCGCVIYNKDPLITGSL